ncbi:MAG: FGGY-family carbohydrate kinase [bacterium]|nr:FGGY-family carbohydrate kinase [bacterium]
MDCIVTLDAGTGSGRCLVFDAGGQPLASAQEPFHYRTFSDPALPLVRGFDLDPEQFWGALARCARAALAQLPADARVRGVVATSQREGCVFLDAAGEVLYAGPNLDARAAMEGLELQQLMSSERLHAITGHAPPYIFPLARWHWFKKHHDAGRVASLLMLNDWIAWELCGARVCEHSNAGESMLYDVTRRAWSDEILTTLDVPAAILPPLCEAGTRVGGVSAAAAAATGIPAGTPVFAGGADTESALLGSGAHRPGQLAAVLGTTSPVQLVTEAPVLDPAGTLWTSCHVVQGRWVLESNAGDTGSAYRWLLGLLFGGHDVAAHAAAETAMAPFDGGPRPMFCHLGPAVFDLRNMNPFQPAGVLFRFPLLHIDRPDRGELLRAFVENVAYAIRGNVEQILALAGTSPDAVLVSGGLTQSPTVLRVLATTLARPLAVARVPESASLGCAILGAVGAGLHPSIPDAVAAMTRSFTVEPDAALAAEFDAGYRRWRDLYATLQTWSLA